MYLIQLLHIIDLVRPEFLQILSVSKKLVQYRVKLHISMRTRQNITAVEESGLNQSGNSIRRRPPQFKSLVHSRCLRQVNLPSNLIFFEEVRF